MARYFAHNNFNYDNIQEMWRAIRFTVLGQKMELIYADKAEELLSKVQTLAGATMKSMVDSGDL